MPGDLFRFKSRERLVLQFLPLLHLRNYLFEADLGVLLLW